MYHLITIAVITTVKFSATKSAIEWNIHIMANVVRFRLLLQYKSTSGEDECS